MYSIKNYKLILASASPRRQQLMKDAGLTFEVRLKKIVEDYPKDLPLEKVPEYLSKVKAEAFREELVRTNAVLEEITGEKISFVRPPYGSWDKSFEKELNMFPVLWNIDPLDWCSHNAECIAARVVEKAGDGDIILMHDYYDTSVIAALEVIDALQGEGFQFVTVEELLFD